MHRHKDVENVNHNELDKDWRDNVSIDERYAGNPQEILDKPAKTSKIGDRRLGRIDIANESLELTALDVRAINYAPYRAGPKAREF